MVNKKTAWHVTNIALRLLVICLVVAALTALVYAVTVDTIAKGEQERKENAIRLIFTEADSFTEDPSIVGEGVNAVYAVADANGAPLGWCVDYTGVSEYGGDVGMMIGVGTDGRVLGLQVISHAETFIDRYLDGENRYTGVEKTYGVDLSAGATMSYNAIRNAIAAVEKIFATRKVAELDGDDGVFQKEQIDLLFSGAADFSQREDVIDSNVNGICLVKNADGVLLGRCVSYTSLGYGGDMELLLSVLPTGKVDGVLVAAHLDSEMFHYTNDNGLYNGADAVAGATRSHRAIQNAITAVEALQLGGAQ
ncbi:MAG: FMN-binding protein [Clostridia bacterium]|nr:FMN-binding protein [Clostridia bacterium]